MANRAEMLIEANKRGLLQGEQKQMFDEAVKRGLIQLPTEQLTDQQLGQVQVSRPPSQLQQAALQRSVQFPAERTALGAFRQGVKRGFQDLGFGILQRGSEVADFLGFDTEDYQAKLRLAEDIERQEFKPTEEARPVAATAGEITGAIASFPVPAQTLIGAVSVGGAYGLLKTAEDKEGIAKNIIQEAAFGGLGQAAAPYIQKGFNKSQALFSGIYKKVTGADPRPEMFLQDGNLSDKGKSALSELGITEEDFSRIYQNLDKNLEPIAAARKEIAKEFGIDLTTGQARQDFVQQEAEQTLKGTVSRESIKARRLEEQQQRQIQEAQEQFLRGVSPVQDREARGEIVQQTLRELQTEGRENVSQLYREAREISGVAAPLENETLLDVVDDSFTRPVETSVINSTEQLLAKFGLVGGEPKKVGRFYQVVEDVGEEEGKKIRFKGEQTPLTLDNAEEFRQGLNDILPANQTGAVKKIINELDRQVGETVEKLPEGLEKTEAFRKARAAHRVQREIFSAKDIVQNLVGYKKGTKTDIVAPDRVIDSIIKGNNSLSEIRKIKEVFLKNPTEKTKRAWASVQVQSVANLFGDSIDPPTGEISGQRLETAIKRFGSGSVEQGEKRLKMIMGEKYNEFNRLRRAIGNATIPIKGTTNPSGTAYKIMNMIIRLGSVNQIGLDTFISLGQKAKDAARAQRTLKQIERADPGKVKQAVKANDALIDSYIQLGLTGTLRGLGTERAE